MPDFNKIVSKQGRLEEKVKHIAKPFSQTAYPCKVVAVHESANCITVDVEPLIQQLTNENQPIDTSIVYGLLVQRIQHGTCAIIIKPKIGDIGTAKICHKDISGFKKAGGKKAPPLHTQPNSYSNAIFEIGSTFAETPVTYITIEDNVITVKSNSLVLDCATVTVNHDLVINGNVTNHGKNISSTHTHSGVQTGGGNTGAVN